MCQQRQVQPFQLPNGEKSVLGIKTKIGYQWSDRKKLLCLTCWLPNCSFPLFLSVFLIRASNQWPPLDHLFGRATNRTKKPIAFLRILQLNSDIKPGLFGNIVQDFFALPGRALSWCSVFVECLLRTRAIIQHYFKISRLYSLTKWSRMAYNGHLTVGHLTQSSFVRFVYLLAILWKFILNRYPWMEWQYSASGIQNSLYFGANWAVGVVPKCLQLLIHLPIMNCEPGSNVQLKTLGFCDTFSPGNHLISMP